MIGTFQSSFSEFDLWNGNILLKAILTFSLFQSSFSEFDLWNATCKEEMSAIEWISILIFWVWPLKLGDNCLRMLKRLSFQSSFSEFDLWNIIMILIRNILQLYFNPHFLSLTFETKEYKPTGKAARVFQSSFSEFDLWNYVTISASVIDSLISILIFWVWPLKQGGD